MFSGLRIRLTLLYATVALALLVLVGAGTYVLLNRYFETTTDLALQFRLAQELRQRNLLLPDTLAAAEQVWYRTRSSERPTAARQEHEEDEHEHDENPVKQHTESNEVYNAELAPVFVLPLNSSGQLLASAGTALSPFPPDTDAAAAALANGNDWRTVELTNNTRVRLLTWRLPSDNPALLQAGRVLNDQTRTLGQLLAVLLSLGGLSVVLLGAGSWWLAGRALRPVQLAWERQQAFVANASHELRTPLTLMRASAEVALRNLPASDADQRMLLNDVVQECDHTSRLVDDLLLLSRLDAKQLVLERKPIVLAEVFADIERQVGRLATERGIRLTTDAAGHVVLGDAVRLRQVLLALLDNALRYTPSGGSIHLDAAQHGTHVIVTVRDTGSGIAPEHLAQVFERFYRADSSRAAPGGSGLGLAIAKALVEAQHGQIAIHSQPGQGTQVTLMLPSE